MAIEFTKEYTLTNDPNQSQTIKVGTRRIKIEIYFATLFWFCDLTDADTEEPIHRGRMIIHGLDLLLRTGLPAKLFYIHPLGQGYPTREDLDKGVLYLGQTV